MPVTWLFRTIRLDLVNLYFSLLEILCIWIHAKRGICIFFNHFKPSLDDFFNSSTSIFIYLAHAVALIYHLP